MAARSNALISARKAPKQARSADLVGAVLEAAVQVLRDEGAHRFTTARVAQRAGVSVGSIYQYFPNKAAILFRLQSDEWRRTSELLRAILQDGRRAPLERLRRLVQAFFLSEWDEAKLRIALGDAAPLYRASPEAKEAKEAGEPIFLAFMQEALPHAGAERQEGAAELVETTLVQLGRTFSETCGSAADVERHASAAGDMVCAYIASLEARQEGVGEAPGG